MYISSMTRLHSCSAYFFMFDGRLIPLVYIFFTAVKKKGPWHGTAMAKEMET